MDELHKQRGRQVSCLRAACSEARDTMKTIKTILIAVEPDAVWMADEGIQALETALARAERMEQVREAA